MSLKMFFGRLFFKIVKMKFVIVGVSAIIRNSKGEILLGKRADNHVAYPGYWGLPGGIVDFNESLRNTAVREVNEEMGVDIKITKQGKKVYEHFPDEHSKLHSVGLVFHAKIVSGIPKPKDETSEVKWFKPSEIREMNLAFSHKRILKDEGLI